MLTSSAAPENSPENVISVSSNPNGGADYDEVRRLAGEYWIARGCPEGSPEEDWFRAEQEVLGKAAK